MRKVLSTLVALTVSICAYSQSLTIKKVGEWGTLFYNNVATSGNYAYCLRGDMMDIIDVSDRAHPFKAGGIITDGMDMLIHNGYGYVISVKGMSVLDISSPLHPVVVAKIAVSGDALRMEISGDHAFVTTMNAGIKIIDIQDSLQPEWIGSYSYAGMGGLVRVSGTTMYVVENETQIHILNIADPLNPVLLGSYNGSASITNFVVGGSYLFVAAGQAITTVNVADPAAPVQAGIYNDVGYPSQLTVRDNYLYVGASGDWVSTFGGIRTVNVTDPSNPLLVGDMGYDASINGFDLVGDSLFVTSQHRDYMFGTDYGLEIYDVADPAHITPVGTYNTAINPSSIAVKGNYGYVCGSGGIRVIDVIDPLTIRQVGMADPPGIGWRIQIDGNYAYVGSVSSGFDIFDLTNPTAPTRVGHCATVAAVNRFCLSGQHVFAAAGNSGLQIINVSDPRNPYSVKVYDTPGSVFNVHVSGNYAYVGDGSLGLLILDVSDPANPVFVSSTPSLDFVNDVVVSGSIAYVANSDSDISGTTTGLHVLNVADPAAPTEIAFYHTSQYLKRLILSGNFLYALQFYQGLLVLDIGTPTLPAQAGFYPYSYDLDDFFKDGDRVYLADYWDNYKITVLQVYGQYLHLTLPNGEKPEPDPEPAERWQVGDSHDITWTGTSNMGNVKLEYSANDGFTWNTIIAATDDDGVYGWTVPDAVSDLCLVRVSDPDGVAADASDAVFSIANDPRLRLTSPVGGESWMVGTAHPITWTSGGPVGNIDIDYTMDSGGTWIPIATGTANDGEFEWAVSNTPSSECYVRIRVEGGFPEDQSPSAFSIVAYSAETVTAPSSAPVGQQWGFVGTENTYTVGGSTSSWGDSVQYLVDWGDGAGAGADDHKVGSDSGWLPVGTTAASHAWSATGTCTVRAKARCATHPTIESDWSTSISVQIFSSPTWAAVTRFGACADSGQPTVEWQTGTESGTVGYNLWRLDRETGRYEQVNATLLPALTNAQQGGAYRLADPGALSFEPVTYQLEEIDAQGKSLTYGPFTVVFGGGSGQDTLGREPRLEREEPSDIYGYQRFARAKSLYEEARLRTRHQELAQATLQAASSKERARVTLKGRGLFYVTAGQIAASLGVPESLATSLIGGHNLKLTTLGKESAWLADANGAGLFFYNGGKETQYSDKNVYFIERGSGLAMDAVSGGNAGPAPDGQTYAETLRFSAGKYFLPSQEKDKLADDWMWEVVAAGGAGKAFALDVPGVVGSGQATLRVVLRGATDTEAANDHHAVVKVNGTEVGSGYWDGGKDYALELTFSASQLVDGANTVEVSGALDMGAPYSIFYVDSIEVSYARRYRAVNNALICKTGGNAVITVNGLTELQAVALELGNERRPRLVTGTSMDVAGRLTFVPRLTDREYLVSGLNAAQRPLSVVGDRPSQLKGRARAAEYIVIAPEEFASTAQELADYRKGKGLKTLVVTLEDIYDAFSFGVTDPNAIRAFLAYANKNWGKVKYAVLAGKGTYDYNDYLGNGDNLVPALLAPSSYGYYAADRAYGDITGKNLVPEIAVGRLPAVTNAELRAMIAKVKAYESGEGEWTGKAIWIADDGSEFARGNAELAGIATGFVNEAVVLAGSASETNAQIMSAWNAGAALVTYCGHGGISQLAQEDIFDADDAAALANGGQLPLATLLTCVAGRFEVPGYTSLAEALALNGSGGMAGGLVPSGAALHEDSLKLAEEFYKAAYRGQAASVGEALVEAMKRYVQQGGKAQLLNAYNWIGDPALRFK